jgi:CheY-like chemotaxis protein
LDLPLAPELKVSANRRSITGLDDRPDSSRVRPGQYLPELAAYTRDHPILITDDEPHIITLYEYILRRQRLHFMSTGDALEALRICRSQLISLIISDFNKPLMNGLEILQELRANVLTSRILFMLVTATPSYHIQEQFKRLGGDSYLVKPVQIDQFVGTTERLVQLHQEYQTSMATERDC